MGTSPSTLQSQQDPESGTVTAPPKRKIDQVAQETPKVQWNSHCSSYTLGDLVQCHDALLSSLPPDLYEHPLEKFILHLLPEVNVTSQELEWVYKEVEYCLFANCKWTLLGELGKELKDFEKFGDMQDKICWGL